MTTAGIVQRYPRRLLILQIKRTADAVLLFFLRSLIRNILILYIIEKLV